MIESDNEAKLATERFLAQAVYRADPWARFLIEKLRLRRHTVALAALAWSVVFLFILPAIFGSLRGSEAYLGSLKDWHAELLLLLVFPTLCAFYLWQPGAIARVYEVILSDPHARGDDFQVAARVYGRGVWAFLSTVVALAVVLFDTPKMIAEYGTWWMTTNWVTIGVREASLAMAFYMTSIMAWRQLIASVQWNHLLARPSAPTVLKAVTAYELSCAFLLALLGLRLSIEGIELPRRAGAITPDYYAKIAIYMAISLACFFAPVGSTRWRGLHVSLSRAISLFVLAGIMAIPLLAFLVLKLII
jgi:hypothetical protein